MRLPWAASTQVPRDRQGVSGRRMCGIVGVAGMTGADAGDGQRLLDQMVSSIRHRGPDDEGVWVSTPGPDGSCTCLGSCRLAIIDLSPAGHQPMLGRDGGALAYNGEIYNFPELRAELEARGVPFRSRSD